VSDDSDYLDSSGLYVCWNPSFLRVVQDWGLESLVVFFSLLYSENLSKIEIKSYGP
jgi:hypothetical protein